MPSIARSAVVLYDAQSRIMQMNAAARRLLGGARWIGHPLSECLAHFGSEVLAADRPGELQERERSGVTFMLNIGKTAWRGEMTVLDAQTAAAGSSTLPGRPDGCHAALILREAGDADDYRDLALARIDFKAALSHDLRTPLNAMVGWLHLLSSPRADDPESAARAIAGLRRAVERQVSLIDERLTRPHVPEPPHTTVDRPVPGTKPEPQCRDSKVAPSQELRTNCLQGVFILAVDDKPEMLEVLSQVLESGGASVVTETSAEQALARYPHWAAGGGERLLISDLAMPGRDGFSLIREIRALERERVMQRLPAVALSAHGIGVVRRRAIEHGYDVFLDKPIEPPVLLYRLCWLLDR